MGNFVTYYTARKHNKEAETNTFKAAGCVFTNTTHILAGYNSKKNLSGFGGKRQGDESYRVTAIRETLEELFDISTVPMNLIECIDAKIKPSRTLIQKSYIILVYSFDDLNIIMDCVYRLLGESRIYRDECPRNLFDLLTKREARPESEITTLCLLPMVKNLKLDTLFLEDMDIL
jgi:hypothetical protein